ncbi:HAMP domain-containing sensor histidine kinase [Roseofilum reptotaenium CS-1145]|uniref:histidine kinase n=1 Tax=Roseofilum reptotaenium AO1-A TaxID=1925591 RepID=A0A1L9QW78_9CYAN|nr:HAMP domain-containing sensor histidine kinase [Roseofilum reptotaenium]MDB9517958.1 HAMP domain-containing sensor histidine kinase [Roseofilum reptotaenium CS-1145]OJJ26951.1 two-component sensor histidine kinase [Roseofilum reptotaenium AO1-A]
MFQRTRRRLALWYTAVTAVLLLCFAGGIYGYVRATLIERIDDTLNHVVEVVERSLIFDALSTANRQSPHFQINLEASFQDQVEPAEDDRIDLEWFSPTGELLWSTWETPLNLPLHFNRMGETVRIARSPHGNLWNYTDSDVLLRQVTDRVQVDREVLGYLRVSHPWFEVTKPTRQLMVDLAAVISLTIIAVAAIGWFLSGLAMEPVRVSYLQLKQFTSDASHELRNPIATIQTNVQVALADPSLDPQQHQLLQVIERLTRRMGRLVNDLLFLARQDSGMVEQHWQSIPLDALVMDVIEEQQLIARSRNLTLDFNLDSPDFPPDLDPFTVAGDWTQLTRLCTNLISNALQYTPTGGTISVCLTQGSEVQLQVKDTGIGIAKADLPYLFDRFYRVDPSRSRDVRDPEGQVATGSGLGLAIVKAIVDNHDGCIKIESQGDRGTTVTVTLPEYQCDRG